MLLLCCALRVCIVCVQHMCMSLYTTDALLCHAVPCCAVPIAAAVLPSRSTVQTCGRGCLSFLCIAHTTKGASCMLTTRQPGFGRGAHVMVWWVDSLCGVCWHQPAPPFDGCLRGHGVFVCRWRRQFCVFVRVAVRVNKERHAGPGHSAEFFFEGSDGVPWPCVCVCQQYVYNHTGCCLGLAVACAAHACHWPVYQDLPPCLSRSVGCLRAQGVASCGLWLTADSCALLACCVGCHTGQHVCCPQQRMLQSDQSERHTEWPLTTTLSATLQSAAPAPSPSSQPCTPMCAV